MNRQTLALNPLHSTTPADINPHDTNPDTYRKLIILDNIRRGQFHMAAHALYGYGTVDSKFLLAIPSPIRVSFWGWDQFKEHLASLKKLIPRLQAIDDNHKENA